MTANFKRRFWKLSKVLLFLFLVLFAFRLIYGYVVVNNESGSDVNQDFFSSIDNLRKNYASEKFDNNLSIANQASFASSQKFEKTASVKSKSSEFEKDEKLIKSTAATYKAVIQYEQNIGKKGNRQIHLLIGVNPALFDSFYTAIQTIGTIRSKEITKVDKTNEYRQLNARKVSIEKALQALNELKSKGGQITDFVSLNDKILEVEEKLQELGVELGNFDAENEFCTVKFSLYEGATEKNISLMERLRVSLEWTIQYYAILAASIFGISLTALILILLADKLKITDAIKNKLDD